MVIPEGARGKSLRRVIAEDHPSLIEENRRLHGFIVEGVPVECRAERGSFRGDAVRLMVPEGRLIVGLSTVIGNGCSRHVLAMNEKTNPDLTVPGLA
jgi:type I restriction enzyme, R subunit